jgi:hypothetical protein
MATKPKPVRQPMKKRVPIDDKGREELATFYSSREANQLSIPVEITKAYYPTHSEVGFHVNARQQRRKDFAKLHFCFPSNFVGKFRESVREFHDSCRRSWCVGQYLYSTQLIYFQEITEVTTLKSFNDRTPAAIPARGEYPLAEKFAPKKKMLYVAIQTIDKPKTKAAEATFGYCEFIGSSFSVQF